jgi:hypothetical protein
MGVRTGRGTEAKACRRCHREINLTTNWQSYYGDNPDTSGFANPPNPQDFDDIMKFSDCTNAVINGRYIVAGRENCVDAVRGANYEWRACSLASGAGVSAVTIKGAIDGWRFIGCTIGRGKADRH